MTRILILAAGSALAFAPTAMAQTAPAAPAPAATAAAATNATVNDTELTQFVTVALEIEKIKKDTTIPDADKTAKMATAASASGIDPARFNAISQAMGSDTALNARVQAKAAQLASAGTPPAAKQP